MSLWKVAKSPLPLPKGSINLLYSLDRHFLSCRVAVQDTDLGSERPGSNSASTTSWLCGLRMAAFRPLGLSFPTCEVEIIIVSYATGLLCKA